MARFSRYLVWVYAAVLVALIVLAVLSFSGVFENEFAEPVV